MRIVFERSGGFTGMIVTTTVDTAILSPMERSTLHSLVEAADFFRLPGAIASPAQPDRFQYQITVEDGDRQHTVILGEAAVPGTLRPLLDWLMDAIRTKRSAE
jgi:hypothetical protein